MQQSQTPEYMTYETENRVWYSALIRLSDAYYWKKHISRVSSPRLAAIYGTATAILSGFGVGGRTR